MGNSSLAISVSMKSDIISKAVVLFEFSGDGTILTS